MQSSGGVNQLLLSACITEVAALRFTPAGLPAVDLQLEHESMHDEAGRRRQVKAAMKAVAFASVAERLARQPLGSQWVFRGFLANPRNGKHPVLHVTDFQPN